MQLALIEAAVARGDSASAERLVAANRALEATTRSVYGLVGESMLAEAHGDDARARFFMEEALRQTVAEQGEQSPARLR